jgi:hypothetical protein
MTLRSLSTLLACAVVLAAGCKDSSPVPHTATYLKIVSGTNQSGDLSAPLDSVLVVQVFDGANKPVANVPLTWAVTGGGSLSATSTTTDNAGKSNVKWTLAPTAGVQVVTVTSSQIVGGSVSFVATNGAMITGTVASNGTQSPFSAFSRTPTSGRSASFTRSGAAAPVPKYVSGSIIVGFKNGALGVASASGASRSLSEARVTAASMQSRLGTLMRGHPLSRAEVSPAILAARLHVDDTTHLGALMDSLRADASVAYVEREGIRSLPTRIVRPADAMALSQRLASLRGNLPTPTLDASAAAKLPNDPNFFIQYWNYNMIDLPRAWSITTGSPNVTVAVLDAGVRFDAPAIAANLTRDGYDFVSNKAVGFTTAQNICGGGSFSTIDGDGDGPDADPTDPDDFDFFDTNNNCWERSTAGDHGLWTAGIIGEAGNDASSGVGVNWTVHIRPIRVLGILGSGSDFDIAQGILYAAGLPATGAGGATVQGSRAPIISMSLGGYGFSSALQGAIAAAVQAGSLIVAAAGNDATDLPSYPASFDGVMSVSAVGPDGSLATYSNTGTFISVAAPGGDYREDDPFDVGEDAGGAWVWGLWWDFTRNRQVFTAAVGTSGSVPHVAGVAALLLAQNPSMTAADIRTRIQQTATRSAGSSRNDLYGWGVVNAYSALQGPTGITRQTYVRLIESTTGATVKTAKVDANGNFALTRLQPGSYYVQAGEDENGDALIGTPGRRFGWAGGFGKPTVFNVTAQSQSAAAIVVGTPTEFEPNDDVSTANLLSVGSYVVGQVTPPDVRDTYRVVIPTAGTYVFETSGLVGSCGFGLELDTILSLATSAGTQVATNDNTRGSVTGPFCARISASLQPGIYYVSVTGSTASALKSHGRYRLEVRAGP